MGDGGLGECMAIFLFLNRKHNLHRPFQRPFQICSSLKMEWEECCPKMTTFFSTSPIAMGEVKSKYKSLDGNLGDMFVWGLT